MSDRMFSEGTRVRVKWECTDSYLQPWRGRFEKGREGTVIGPGHVLMGQPRIRVQWDHNKRGKPHDFRLDMPALDLEVVSPFPSRQKEDAHV